MLKKLAAITCLYSLTASAVDFTANGGTTASWNTGTSWSGGVVPVSGSTANFPNTKSWKANLNNKALITNVTTNGTTTIQGVSANSNLIFKQPGQSITVNAPLTLVGDNSATPVTLTYTDVGFINANTNVNLNAYSNVGLLDGVNLTVQGPGIVTVNPNSTLGSANNLSSTQLILSTPIINNGETIAQWNGYSSGGVRLDNANYTGNSGNALIFYDNSSASIGLFGGTHDIDGDDKFAGGSLIRMYDRSIVNITVGNFASVYTHNDGGFCETDYNARNTAFSTITVNNGSFTNGSPTAGHGGMFNWADRVQINNGTFANYDYMLGGVVFGTISGGSISNIQGTVNQVKMAESATNFTITGGQLFNNGALFNISGATLSYRPEIGNNASNINLMGNATITNTVGRIGTRAGTITISQDVKVLNIGTVSGTTIGSFFSSRIGQNANTVLIKDNASITMQLGSIGPGLGNLSILGGTVVLNELVPRPDPSYIDAFTTFMTARNVSIGGNATITNNSGAIALGGGPGDTTSFTNIGSTSFINNIGTISGTSQLVAVLGRYGGTCDIGGSAALRNRLGIIAADYQSLTIGNQASIISYAGTIIGTYSYYPSLASFSNNVTIKDDAFIQNGTIGLIGPMQGTITGGSITNNGWLLFDQIQPNDDLIYERSVGNSYITSGGSITGAGEIWVAGNLYMQNDVTQSNIFVGQGSDISGQKDLPQFVDVYGALYANTTLNVPVQVGALGSLRGNGTVNNCGTVYGDIYAGVDTVSLGTLNIPNGAKYSGRTSLSVAINGANSNLLHVGGTLSLDPQTSINIASLAGNPIGPQTYTIADFDNLVGSFDGITSQVPFSSKLFSWKQVGDTIQLNALFNLELDFAGGNVAATANQLNAMINSGNYLPETYNLYVDLLYKSKQDQIYILSNFGSSQKVIQYQIEKLDLLLHKELDHELYADRKGTHGFILGGYDNFAQKSRHGFAGYDADHYYQLIGGTHDWGAMKWLGALGASESYEKLKPSFFSAKASYYTVWGTVGVASSHKKWIYGLDGLFGYSFIDAKRHVPVFNLNAFTSHGMWNASLDGKIGYKFTVGKVGFTGYDNVGYIYGHENDYTEHGASGDNLAITDENISMIRNQLGLKMEGPIDKKLKVFTDLAWVYEYYFGDNNYKQRFVGSPLEATVTQTVPTKNYVRINAGFEGKHDRFDWRLAYTGLYGKVLADSAISLKLGYKF